MFSVVAYWKPSRGLISAQPNPNGCELAEGKLVCGEFVIPGSDAPALILLKKRSSIRGWFGSLNDADTGVRSIARRWADSGMLQIFQKRRD
jgi:hypothetical protein